MKRLLKIAAITAGGCYLAFLALLFAGQRMTLFHDLGHRLSMLFPHCTLITLEGAHHNDVLDRAEVLKQIVDFALGSP